MIHWLINSLLITAAFSVSPLHIITQVVSQMNNFGIRDVDSWNEFMVCARYCDLHNGEVNLDCKEEGTLTLAFVRRELKYLCKKLSLAEKKVCNEIANLDDDIFLENKRNSFTPKMLTNQDFVKILDDLVNGKLHVSCKDEAEFYQKYSDKKDVLLKLLKIAKKFSHL
jgi:hypothetical protein